MYHVYKLIRDGVVVYVGRTIDIYSRIQQHKVEKSFNKVLYCTLDTEEEMHKIESLLIYKLLPKLNRRFEKYKYVLEASGVFEEDTLKWDVFDDKLSKTYITKGTTKRVKKVDCTTTTYSYREFLSTNNTYDIILLTTKREVLNIKINKTEYIYTERRIFTSVPLEPIVEEVKSLVVDGKKCVLCSDSDNWVVSIGGKYYRQLYDRKRILK